MTRRRKEGSIEPCIYCNSTAPRFKREHVLTQALGKFEQNWVLDCVCDECNEYFSKNLELPLTRDSVEAFFRLDLGLKPASEAGELLNRRIKGTLQNTGIFEGARMIQAPSEDGTETFPIPVPQVGFKTEGKPWTFLTEKELNEDAIQALDGTHVEIKVFGHGGDTARLVARLAELGIEFGETGRMLDQPVVDGTQVTVAWDFDVDKTIIRAAAKIAFNYAARVLGSAALRRPEFNAARRFVRWGEAGKEIAQARHESILVGPSSATAKVHACGLGWDSPRQQLVAVVSLFNTVTYRIRLCGAESDEWRGVASYHIFDPVNRTITAIGIST